LQEIHHRLSDVSRLLLTPVAHLMQGKTQVLVLPDGALNLLPFDLLTATPTTYRPLLHDVVVRVVPSLRLLHTLPMVPGQPGKATGLVALGDPVYAKAPEVAGLSEAELRTIMRGDAYRSYFTPLPETRTEVEAISRLFRQEPVRLLLGPQATKSALTQLNLQS